MVLRPATPRVNAIFGSDASAETVLQEVLEKIGRDFLFGKVANIVASSDGCYEAAVAPHITEKLEEFLRVVEEQRANHLRRTPGLDSDAIFTSFHMQEIHKEWMNDHGSWMNAETVQEYEWWRNGWGKGDQQKARQLRRSAFSAYLFQIIGNKNMCCSPASNIQSAVLHSLQTQYGGSSTRGSRRSRRLTTKKDADSRTSYRRTQIAEEDRDGGGGEGRRRGRGPAPAGLARAPAQPMANLSPTRRTIRTAADVTVSTGRPRQRCCTARLGTRRCCTCINQQC